MTLEALIFDVDGTLAETEELHRQSFNRTFEQFGLDWRWEREDYPELLQTTGGKERLVRFIEDRHPERRDLLARIGELHAAKSAAYLELLAEGALGLKPGVTRLIHAARAAGVKLAIATTTTPGNVEALLRATLGEASPGWFAIAAGDMVARKKPDPAVYLEALRLLEVDAGRAVAFEDSVHGISAARAAKLAVVATPSFYLAHDDLSAATSVVSDLGEPDAPLRQISGTRFEAGMVDLDGLRAMLTQTV